MGHQGKLWSLLFEKQSFNDVKEAIPGWIWYIKLLKPCFLHFHFPHTAGQLQRAVKGRHHGLKATCHTDWREPSGPCLHLRRQFFPTWFTGWTDKEEIKMHKWMHFYRGMVVPVLFQLCICLATLNRRNREIFIIALETWCSLLAALEQKFISRSHEVAASWNLLFSWLWTITEHTEL